MCVCEHPREDDEFSFTIRGNGYIISKNQSIKNRNISFFFLETQRHLEEIMGRV